MKIFSFVFAALIALAAPAQAQTRAEVRPQDGQHPERVALGHGISFAVPEGWSVDREDPRLVFLTCETAACEQTQEICRVWPPTKKSGFLSDAEAIEDLYNDPMTRYFRMRAVRLETSQDAEFRRQLGPMTIGGREWAVAETDARHNMKSGLFAQTFIGGWKVSVSCKTCETGEIRHSAAMAMLESFRAD